MRQIWRISRMEFVFAFIALLGTISLGVLNGVLIAIAATMVSLEIDVSARCHARPNNGA